MQSPRLGVALSGGGFRAAFFHLGVLRRLAELDLLRHVATLSTVSGGSILAAHYYLHLKEALERKNRDLTREEYIAIVEAVEKEFIDGNRADIRNRLLMNPWTHFRTIAFGRSYGKPMARLYAKHFYRKVTQRMWGQRKFANSGVPLHEAVVLPIDPARGPAGPRHRDPKVLRESFRSSGYPGITPSGQPLREVNANVTQPLIPRLVLNATCLNSGGTFSFTPNEVGGPEIGFIRTDEVFILLQYKALLANLKSSTFPDQHFLEMSLLAYKDGEILQKEFDDLPKTAFRPDQPFPPQTAAHVRLFLAGREGAGLTGENSRPIRFLNTHREALRRLLTCDFGTLRRAKVAAWYLLDEPFWPADQDATRAGFTRSQWSMKLQRALADIHRDLLQLYSLQRKRDPEVLKLIVDFYYFRSAETVGWKAPQALSELTLARAVAASANFPPVFTPFKIFDLFDSDSCIDVLSLTDGGVYDNQGMTALVNDGCNYILASDAGGLVELEALPAEARLPMMDRIVNVLMGGLRRMQIDTIRREASTLAADKQTLLLRATIFHMTDEAKSVLRPYEPVRVAQLRTDLDAFSDIEIAVLLHNGYVLADGYANWFATDPSSPFRSAQPVLPPTSKLPPEKQLRRASALITGGAKRVNRFSTAFPWMASAAALAAAILAAIASADSYAGLQWLWDHDDLAVAVSELGTAQQHIEGTGLTATIRDVRLSIAGFSQRQSIVAIGFMLWAIYIASRPIRRALRQWFARRRTSRQIEIAKESLLRIIHLLRRTSNVTSLICVGAFLVTFRARWLLGIIPLWSIAIAIAFTGNWLIYSKLWLGAGRIRQRA